ncbi:hypothetical protein NS274_19750 [Pseudomonas oryzihabitans]|uniref:putative hemolysin n=1 Tax=Pseudomonas rhizoryzae TaxID=2571129 RepID=UPI0007372576|nr:DUF333 domain-containing protein [Pseudomonas rhizoryzae]KTS73863.1 hypothetical protein NS274_19750 [Pseudomonas psychrotolerans]KTT33888.1 hypothetical protein NS201_04240 [Pseudomonas psychrotolerans]KTT37281.1 hypothetical protein SB9_03130 [Pseudomonas psychrotolerans]KTT40414.1 hypothetical protein SB5_07340 [Pseudomonas psychrotolerans]KTT46131.1 hypothetical protein RSA46_05090 [Pseudomonas psychrotolerans]
MRAVTPCLLTTALFGSLLLAAGCTRDERPAHNSYQLANPASEYCISQGGRVDIRQDAIGNQYGMCHFADGHEVEEWALYRRAHP